ncbi:ribosome-inactivating family protein [Streptomyces sp. ADMS]|uniref:ribosome-inactivating family protein n=1 Tax=Streptomyces sp. ADMS TaxID=3071415 RepID=UPI00296FB287|nr:ribosome-inactivating family protein [Streptomyces sp. ADMS]MDW4908456.1 ribosome-inactivating family protein [Streptomyces sp. ADMS]
MNVNVITRFGVPAALAATLIGGASLEGFTQAHTTHADAAHSVTLNPGDVELSSSSQQFHAMNWPLVAGPSGANNYASMIGNLRAQARMYANAQRRRILDADGVQRNIDITDQSEDNQFADITISIPGGPALHAVVRLSNYYVVQFYYINGGHRHTFNLADVATPSGSSVTTGFPEGYDALSGPRWANRALNTVNLGHTAFESAVLTLRNPAASQQARARSMQTLIIGIAEGARIREIEESVHAHWRNSDQHTLTDQDVHAMRNWGAASDILRNNGGRHVTLYGRSVHNAATAAIFLLTALGARHVSSSGGHDGEL